MAESIYDQLEPSGAIVLVAPDIDAGPVPEGPGAPPIPHELIGATVARYLGKQRRFGSGKRVMPSERYEHALARTRFGRPVTHHAPARTDITRDIDGVISGILSMSWAAPHLFGDRLADFVDELRSALTVRTETGRFWDWPGDTAVLIARRRA